MVGRSGPAGNTSRDSGHRRTTRRCLRRFTRPSVAPRKDSRHSGSLKSERRFRNRDLRRVRDRRRVCEGGRCRGSSTPEAPRGKAMRGASLWAACR